MAKQGQRLKYVHQSNGLTLRSDSQAMLNDDTDHPGHAVRVLVSECHTQRVVLDPERASDNDLSRILMAQFQ